MHIKDQEGPENCVIILEEFPKDQNKKSMYSVYIFEALVIFQ